MNKKAQSSCFRTCELRREVYKNQVIQIRQVRNNNTQSNRQFPSVATIDDDCNVEDGARGGPAELQCVPKFPRIVMYPFSQLNVDGS